MRTVALILLAACGGSSATTATKTPPPSHDQGLVAFETVRTVLQHPRCQNCHPAGDAPLQGDDSHVPSQNVQRGPEAAAWSARSARRVMARRTRRATTASTFRRATPTVGTCHRPEMKLVFVGMSANALCVQIKDPARNGGKDLKALRAHLDSPLVEWGWNPGFRPRARERAARDLPRGVGDLGGRRRAVPLTLFARIGLGTAPELGR